MDLLSKLFGGGVVTIAPSEAHTRMQKKPKPVLIDVRQPDEFRGGHVPGARLFPLTQLQKQMDQLPKDQEILVMCASGHRSLVATKQLKAAGFHVTNIDGGMGAWMKARLPVTKGK